MNRAGLILNDDLALTLRYKSCQAKLCDFKRQFIPASTRYFELSNCQGLALSEQIEALKFAVTCAVLAPAGPPRSRLLALLYKDDRVREASEFSENETGLYPILEKMYKGRLIHKSQVEKFEKTLRQHQLAQHQGKTVLDRAVLEHNMLATTQIYINISFDQLGSLLGVSAIEAEGIASRMILEKRMEGSVDQVDQVLTFKERSRMREWDLIVGGICEGVEEIIGMLDVKVSGGKRCA